MLLREYQRFFSFFYGKSKLNKYRTPKVGINIKLDHGETSMNGLHTHIGTEFNLSKVLKDFLSITRIHLLPGFYSN